MALLTTSGIPSDATGAAGDYAIDPVAHFIYGPKTSTWVGTASNLTGPSGPGMVYGQGAPTNAQGSIGQGYLDLLTGNFYGPKASNGAWGNAVSKIQGAAGTSALSGSGSPITNNVTGVEGQSYLDSTNTVLYVFKNGGWGTGVSLIGAQGTPGPTYLTGFATACGLEGFIQAQTLSATPTVMMIPGTTTPAAYTPLAPSAFMGCYAYSGIAATVTLVNAANGAVVWSSPLTAGVNLITGVYATNQYPLTQGVTYQFQVTGSGSTSVQLTPFWLTPSNSPGAAISMFYPSGYAASQTFSGTSQNLPPFGAAQASGYLNVYTPIRTGGIYSAQATYTPTGGTPSTATVTLSLKYAAANNSVSGSGTVGGTTATITASGLPQTIVTPRLTDLSSLPVNFYFYWTVTGSGTGTLLVTLYPIV